MDIEKLKNFIKNGWSAGKIANDAGMSSSTVLYWVKKYQLSEDYANRGNRCHKRGVVTSPIRIMTRDDLQKLVNESFSFNDILSKLGYNQPSGSTHNVLRFKIRTEGIDLTEFKSNKKKRMSERKLTGRNVIKDSEIFIENSEVSSGMVKYRVKKGSLIDYLCAKCGNRGNYFGEPLVLQLDHINGISNDHRLSNLRFLCPNCHSQTSTWGRKRRGAKTLNKCAQCEQIIGKKSKICRSCCARNNSQNASPVKLFASIEEIVEEVRRTNFTTAGKKFGVSDNALRKRLKKEGINPKNIKNLDAA